MNRHLLLRAPSGPLPPGDTNFLEPYNPADTKERERQELLKAKGITQGSSGGKGVSGEKPKKPKKRMTRVRRQAMNAVNLAAAIIQGLYRGWKVRTTRSWLDAHFDRVVDRLVSELDNENQIHVHVEESTREMALLDHWIGKDPEAIEAAHHAATMIQASMRGCFARSGKQDAHLERMVDKIMEELINE